MGLKIKRELPVMLDCQQVEIHTYLCVQHQILIKNVFAQRFRVRRQSR